MKKFISIILALCVMATAFTACAQQRSDEGEATYTGITLSDDGVLVGGTPASADSSSDVYVSDDIVFYLEGQGEDYGEGEKDEEHSQTEADKHTVINITRPGNYMITGSISHGQIAVNLGENAENNPDAVVNIVLNNADITCTVAPAIVCYNAYECGPVKSEEATKDVDTETAGFNITLADGSVNNISGSHVAKIYKPGTEKKLHKYDAAIESMVSFNINGDDGILNLASDNEGIETKMHMTINGGEININSQDDALNAGEDGVSVITINGGQILANSNNGAEGDGIDSNGWIVINDGYLSAFASEKAMESGLDSDLGTYINGGTVFAAGSMYDEISSESTQTFAVFSMDWWIYGEEYLVLKSSEGDATAAFKSPADYRVMVYSSPLLTEDDYTLYKAESVTGESLHGIYANITDITGEIQMAHSSSFGNSWPAMPQDGNMPQLPQGGDDRLPQAPPENMPRDSDFTKFPDDIGNAELPEDFKGKMPKGEKGERPQRMGGMTPPDVPDGENAQEFDKDRKNHFAMSFGTGNLNPVFSIVKGGNMFSRITEYTQE